MVVEVEEEILQGFAKYPGRRIWRNGEERRRSSETDLQLCVSPLGPAPLYIGGRGGLGGFPKPLVRRPRGLGGGLQLPPKGELEVDSNFPPKGELEVDSSTSHQGNPKWVRPAPWWAGALPT